ncbi:hypothetical protein QML37_30030, partial [Klebsiella pneumoniae]|uniref:hypothetical protein n=1 Tax=Klebsiella pneumoniae TaxID=573 RepID=UPI003A80D0B3
MKHHIGSKGLLGYIDGSKTKPTLSLLVVKGNDVELEGNDKQKIIREYEKQLETRMINNHKIITWLLTNVDVFIGSQLSNFDVAFEACEFLKKVHTMKDAAHKFNIQPRIAVIKQGDKSIKEYYEEYSELWDQLSLFEPNWECPKDIILRQKQIEEDKLYGFLKGLRPEFDVTRTTILHRGDKPFLSDVL